jgi:bifunctional non-homologous end joining protein LigD
VAGRFIYKRKENIMQTTLYYREGSSDKVYQVAIEPKDSQFVVNFAYGRRGTTLQTGTKTSTPVDHATAVKVFEKLVRAKQAKGYTQGEEGTPYQHSDKQVSGIQCQLLSPIEEGEAKLLLKDTRHAAQEKYDGKRMLLLKLGSAVSGVNRKGFIIGVPAPLVEGAIRLPGDFIVDGEAVGNRLFVFDLLSVRGENLTRLPYQERFFALIHLLSTDSSHDPAQPIQLAPNATTPEAKARLWEELKEQKKEGIVFKRLDAPYTPGRPSSGGPQLKHKFYATLSAVVAQVNAKRSVGIQLLNCEGGWMNAGKVTIPANQPIPQAGAVVEIRYYLVIRIMPSASGIPPHFFWIIGLSHFATRHNQRLWRKALR